MMATISVPKKINACQDMAIKEMQMLTQDALAGIRDMIHSVI
jgi:hypothetical protein